MKKKRRTDHHCVEVSGSAGFEGEVSLVKHSVGSFGLLSSSNDGGDDSSSLESSVDGKESLDVEPFADVKSDLSSLGSEGLSLSVDLREEGRRETGVGNGSGGRSEGEGLSDLDRELLVDLPVRERRRKKNSARNRSDGKMRNTRNILLTFERLSRVLC